MASLSPGGTAALALILAMVLIKPVAIGTAGVDRILDLPPAERAAAVRQLTPEEQQALLVALKYDWRRWARWEQLQPDGPWDVWVMLAGRGGGKTRPAAELVVEWAVKPTYAEGNQARIAVVGREMEKGTIGVMVDGDSGILACSPPWFPAHHHVNKKRITWPKTEYGPGTVAELYAAFAPKTLRGPQFHKGWGDEVFAWHVKDGATVPEAWDKGLDMGVRLGREPQIVLTSSPTATEFCRDTVYGPRQPDRKRLVRKEDLVPGPDRVARWQFVLELGDTKHRTVVHQWPSERNSDNLAPGKIAKLRAKYRDTRLGLQELDGLVLDKVEGALWDEDRLKRMRATSPGKLRRIAIALDPTRSDDPGDECGIIVGGLGEDGKGRLLADNTVHGSPAVWAAAGVAAYDTRKAEAAVFEQNAIGDRERDTMATAGPHVHWMGVQAVSDKYTRAAPISALGEQRKILHVCPNPAEHAEHEDCDHFAILEAELTGWDPKSGRSPNRLDAYVWLFTYLMLGVEPAIEAVPVAIGRGPSKWRR